MSDVGAEGVATAEIVATAFSIEVNRSCHVQYIRTDQSGVIGESQSWESCVCSGVCTKAWLLSQGSLEPPGNLSFNLE